MPRFSINEMSTKPDSPQFLLKVHGDGGHTDTVTESDLTSLEDSEDEAARSMRSGLKRKVRLSFVLCRAYIYIREFLTPALNVGRRREHLRRTLVQHVQRLPSETRRKMFEL